MNAIRFRRQARGVTLIELMIAIVIGMVVVAAVMVTFVNSGKAGRYQAALNQMNQDAQVALNMLSRDIQLAGFVAPGNSLGDSGVSPLFGCDATKSGTSGVIPFDDATVKYESASKTGQPTCSAKKGAPTISALEVVYQADALNTVPTTDAPPVPTNCTGSGAIVITPLTFYIARNRYFVDWAGSGRPELYCAASGSAKVPVMENVEDMQIWYGVSSTATPNRIVRYAKAGEVNAVGATEWDNVMAARICLLMRSAEPILTEDDAPGYQDCEGNNIKYADREDRYLRRAYYTTATVRSKMLP